MIINIQRMEIFPIFMCFFVWAGSTRGHDADILYKLLLCNNCGHYRTNKYYLNPRNLLRVEPAALIFPDRCDIIIIRKSQLGKGSSDMKEMRRIRHIITRIFTDGTNAEKLPVNRYSRFSYPKLIPFMKFEMQQYRVPGFGKMMTLITDTPFGMQLLTCSFMPYEGGDVPYLLIDIMTVGKKRTIFVEYYDCTAEKRAQPKLAAVHGKYAHLSEYNEKPAWYVGERADYSLIKSLSSDEDISLAKIAADSVRAYRKAALSAERHTENLDGLLKFRRRMINEGNPSSAVLKKVFGEKGAEKFFVTCVMPEK